MSESLIEWEMVKSIKAVGSRCNNPNYFSKILELYEKQSVQMLGQVEQSLQANNFAALAHIAHSMKGSSLCLGANRLAAACDRFEVAVKSEGIEKSQLYGMVEDVKHTFNESLAALKTQSDKN
jgi:HPt (histidine-containing phosphotransfer) domain-containing protein